MREEKEKKKDGGSEKGGGGGENSPISPPLDPRLKCDLFSTFVQHSC